MAAAGVIRVPVEIDVCAVVDGERVVIGTGASELTLRVDPGSGGALRVVDGAAQLEAQVIAKLRAVE